jgi:deoxyribose-phosphate aldolase
MLIEFSQHDHTFNDHENKELIVEALKYKPSLISVFPYYIKTISQLTSIPISCAIDYPVGTSDSKTRLTMAEFAIKNGARALDITYSSSLLNNRKYDKFREDVKNFNNLGIENNIDIRYILEYRKYSYELLYKITQILLELGVSTVLLSTGYFLDDINDNIIAASMISKKNSNINIILTGNIWHNDQVTSVVKSGMTGVRLYTINSLKIFHQNAPYL